MEIVPGSTYYNAKRTSEQDSGAAGEVEGLEQ